MPSEWEEWTKFVGVVDEVKYRLEVYGVKMGKTEIRDYDNIDSSHFTHQGHLKVLFQKIVLRTHEENR